MIRIYHINYNVDDALHLQVYSSKMRAGHNSHAAAGASAQWHRRRSFPARTRAGGSRGALPLPLPAAAVPAQPIGAATTLPVPSLVTQSIWVRELRPV